MASPLTVDRVFLALGTNQGDRLQHLSRAVSYLSAILTQVQCSYVYETPALLPQDAPPSWNISYYNMVISGKTYFTDPEHLLNHIQLIEQRLGRAREHEHWGPRPMDIDILLWSERTYNSPRLTIPHAAMKERLFMLIPLLDVYPAAAPLVKSLLPHYQHYDETALKREHITRIKESLTW